MPPTNKMNNSSLEDKEFNNKSADLIYTESLETFADPKRSTLENNNGTQ